MQVLQYLLDGNLIVIFRPPDYTIVQYIRHLFDFRMNLANRKLIVGRLSERTARERTL